MSVVSAAVSYTVYLINVYFPELRLRFRMLSSAHTNHVVTQFRLFLIYKCDVKG